MASIQAKVRLMGQLCLGGGEKVLRAIMLIAFLLHRWWYFMGVFSPLNGVRVETVTFYVETNFCVQFPHFYFRLNNIFPCSVCLSLLINVFFVVPITY